MTASANKIAAVARCSRWLAPSLAFAIWGALVCGFAEGTAALGNVVAAVAAAGFLAILWVPAMLVASVVARVLWRSWRHRLLASDAPRIAAWCVYAICGTAIVWRAGLVATAHIIAGTEAKAAATATLTTATVVGIAMLLAIFSHPVVSILTKVMAAIDGAFFRRTGIRALTPARILAVSAMVLAALALTAWWLSIRPRFASVNLAPLQPVWLGLVAGALAQGSWHLWLSHRPRGAAIAAATTAASLTLALALATHAWARNPNRALAIWGETELAGRVVDHIVDVWELGRQRAPHVSSQPGESTRPNVVLVTIDTLRADRTPVYGGAAEMPALSRLAETGAVLEWAFSPGNVTRRSLPAMLTGVAPPRLSGRVNAWAYKLDPRHVTFPELFQAGGYDTAGFFCCGSIFSPDQKLGLVRGFDNVFVKEYACEDIASAAVDYIKDRRARADTDPAFVWLHFFEPHQWHKIHVPGEKDVTVERRYAAALERVDHCLSTLVSTIWTDIRTAKTVVAVTSDHGEGLGSHGIPHHSGTLYNSEIHVPLIIVGPEIKPRRLETPVALVDLAPTLLDLAGFVPPGMPAMDGESLAPLLLGEVTDSVDNGGAYAAMIPDHSTVRSSRALIVGRHKIIAKGLGFELYDYVADPGETHDLAKSRPRLFLRLRNALEERRKKDLISPLVAPP